MPKAELKTQNAVLEGYSTRSIRALEFAPLTWVTKYVKAVKEQLMKLSLGHRLTVKNDKQLYKELKLKEYCETVLINFEEGLELRPEEFLFSIDGFKDYRAKLVFRTNGGIKYWSLLVGNTNIPLTKKQKIRLNAMMHKKRTESIKIETQHFLQLSNEANQEFKKDKIAGKSSIMERKEQVEMDVPF